MACAPQRFLANDRNLVRDAVLTPSSVLPIERHVEPVPRARRGTAEARITGAYDGNEQADIEIEVTDTLPGGDVIVSAPVFAGAGSAKLVDVAATGLASQTVVVELVDAGAPATYAAVSFEGVFLKARTIGTPGNLINISIDQTGLVYAASDFALLVDLKAGTGGPTSGVEGAGMDWDTKVLGTDNVIPANAHRVAFGEDKEVYLQYKRYVDNRWSYHLVPELRRDIPKGTPIKFVTGGREVVVTDGTTTETYSNVATVYDFLIGIRQTSALLEVDGVVANDRSPIGQAARELSVRTDAHVEPSTGSGSQYATGFINAFANPTARTELVTATAFAVNSKDHPEARLGMERWEVRSSLGGIIGTAITGEPFVDPDGRWGFTIERKVPPGYGGQRGRFSKVGQNPVARGVGEPDMPPCCPEPMLLGPEASDQIITLRWTKRPSGDCDCSDLPGASVGGPCLGVDAEGGGGDMPYTADAIDRLKDLYDWGNELSSALAKYVAGYQRDDIPENIIGGATAEMTQEFAVGGTLTLSGPAGLNTPYDGTPEPTTFADDVTTQLTELLDIYEEGIKLINEVTDTALVADGWAKWDDALAQWRGDFEGSPSLMAQRLQNFAIEKYRILVRQAVAYAGVSPLGKSDASADQSGDGCWRDRGDPYYFTVIGSEKGEYAPLFPNTAYYSSRRASDKDKYLSTHEFGLSLNIKKNCIRNLREGDEVILQIGDAAWMPTYQNGDVLTLAVIAAQALFLAGGRNDNSEQTWSVTGSEFGPFPPWVFTPGGTGTAYSEDGLSFDIEEGGIPNQKGDRWVLELTGAHWRWRFDGGAWNGPFAIPVGPTALQDGLFVEFVPGAAPVFFTGDTYAFTALQPNAVSNVRTPRPGHRWRWALETPDVADLLMDFGSAQDIDLVAIAQHTIPAGATLTVAGGSTPSTADWSHAITWRPWLMVQPLPQLESARYVKVTITDGGSASIGWIWAGVGLSTEHPAEVTIRPTFRIGRGDANTQSGQTFGSGRGAEVSWGPSYLSEADQLALDEMVWYVKTNHDEPLILMPNILRPQDSVFGLIGVDQLDWEEKTSEQAWDGALRRYSTEFPIIPIWQR